ncbi:MAG: hypothetical protein L0338_05880 [Acidobacteria bacterium]|nr:hypothetical protein [Acidobacteriota bacterium]
MNQNTMPIPEFLEDLIRLLLNLAPVSALGCLVFAGISLRREGVTSTRDTRQDVNQILK